MELEFIRTVRALLERQLMIVHFVTKDLTDKIVAEEKLTNAVVI